MVSSIAWMDTSADEQRRVRDMIALFAQPESRDELGIGQIRDAVSDLLFPGTSVLLTRARYFLLVPWGYKYVTRRGPVRDVDAQARRIERILIEVLVKSDDWGVIGRRAGARVKNLPSALFWSGLVRYGILTREASPEQLSGALLAVDGADELAIRQVGEWHPTLPSPPEGFPWSLEDGTGLNPLDLRRPEAEWLRERIVEGSRGTLLEHLVHAKGAPAQRSDAPWEDRVCLRAPQGPAGVLRHARAFSLLVNGASILYNILVAKAYEVAGFDRIQSPTETHRMAYEEWMNRAEAMDRLRDWDLAVFWALIDSRPNRISQRSLAFVEDVAGMVRAGTAHRVLDEPNNPMWATVSSREQFIKGGQSRLGTNHKLLGAWGGNSGAGALTYRWTQVRGIVTDIHQGLARA